MAIQVKWDEGLPILHYSIEGSWTWDEFYQTRAEGRALLEAATAAKVDTILNLTGGDLFPSNVLSHMNSVAKTSHPKMGRMAVVGAGLFATMLFKLMRRINPKSMERIYFATTLDEARSFLQAQSANPSKNIA